MKMFNRMLLVGALAGTGTILAPALPAVAQEQAAAPKVTSDELGQMIAALGLQPTKKESRYDFAFQAQLQDQEWALSMSVSLSQDGSALWVIAWLDELPKASTDVPRAALLRLLAQNDQLGDGKFFAYIPNARRFVMQRSIPNAGLTSAKLRLLLQDLGSSVVETYPIWSTSNWNPTGTPVAPIDTPAASLPNGVPAQSVSNDSKFEQPVRR
ncbi:type III secretion system chaperone [Planctomicrobium piriforme]|uniref:Sensory transduction regulator n=1 Tax=Planctomicrobium piriforme TaxID=1576369 RepID=A0A1I3N734_9PLAN|nr:type III secretion system chaperone [Planctomicrobium piriforme]SFJ04676.1 hypothetical protein SAMN05421753_1153 [Planctomicrobium piriforme]